MVKFSDSQYIKIWLFGEPVYFRFNELDIAYGYMWFHLDKELITRFPIKKFFICKVELNSWIILERRSTYVKKA